MLKSAALENIGALKKTGALLPRAPDLARTLLDDLAVQSEVEAVALDLFADAQADDRVDDLQDDEGDDRVIGDDGHDADHLVDELAGIAFEQAGRAAILADREDAGQQRADYAADRMDAEAVQRVVIAESVLQDGRAEI